MASKLYIGTSGYYYEDWRKVFYPPELAKVNMLGFYAQHFNSVEINATYYKIPPVHTFQRMANNTPDGFQFIVKTHQETTHRRLENEQALRTLSESVRPLHEQGKFSGFLAQFPYSFKNNEKNRRYLALTRKLLGETELFVEFRNDSWVKSPIPDFLQQLDIGYVNVDQPRLQGLLPPQDIITGGCGYVRLHGRNHEEWWQGKGSTRYDYQYKEEELQEWLKKISHILRKTYKTFIFFNNHPNGQAIKNAKQMIEILKSKSR